ncbi:MAG: hypothetical protein IKI72_04030 [Bacteroidales bacterium]|nr:hypothetical protein [Bacteroidales bacterium]
MSIIIGIGGGQSKGPGGSTAGAVRYDEAQQLTEAQQMLARKNQGLYYEMEVGEPKVAKYTDETVEWGRALVSTDTPDDAAINGLTKDGVDVEYQLVDVKEGEQDDTYVQFYDEELLSWETVFTVQRGTGITSATGIYIGPSFKDAGYELHYGVQTEKQTVPEKFLPDDSLTTAEIDTIWDSVMD